ncbi:aminotransferase class IV family protein [uncultured Roseovarius sp.]|uniref:aminotransferase class IV family protein n=1 Tax=uncultured Roseovarius sp. TaxID=293344 RepID=UPI0026388CCF|nr:aminotransferase class IV family protein [uncultured Roseovarius sp.]
MESPLCPPSDPGFRLIETFRWEPGSGILRRARHLARLVRSAARLGIETKGVEAALETLEGDAPLRVRLTVDAKGQAEVTSAPFQAMAEGAAWCVGLSDAVLDADDPWLHVKTTQRHVYDTARANLPAGVDELLFLNARQELCEGTITNLFVDLGAGLITPPLCCGLLPGVLREEMIAKGAAQEAVLTVDDLRQARAIYVGNSLRGLIPSRLVGL